MPPVLTAFYLPAVKSVPPLTAVAPGRISRPPIRAHPAKAGAAKPRVLAPSRRRTQDATQDPRPPSRRPGSSAFVRPGLPHSAGSRSSTGEESMRLPHWISAPVVKGIGLAFVLVVVGAVAAVLDAHGGAGVAAQAPAKLEATIFSYDGHDFV